MSPLEITLTLELAELMLYRYGPKRCENANSKHIQCGMCDGCRIQELLKKLELLGKELVERG